MPAIPRWPICIIISALALLAVPSFGCHCEECHPKTLLRLPELSSTGAEAVTVELRRKGDSAPLIRCVLAKKGSAATDAWSCSSAPMSNPPAGDGSHFYFDLENPSEAWLVHLSGPGGVSDITATPYLIDEGGEPWPTQCPVCDPYVLTLQPESFAAVLAPRAG